MMVMSRKKFLAKVDSGRVCVHSVQYTIPYLWLHLQHFFIAFLVLCK